MWTHLLLQLLDRVTWFFFIDVKISSGCTEVLILDLCPDSRSDPKYRNVPEEYIPYKDIETNQGRCSSSVTYTSNSLGPIAQVLDYEDNGGGCEPDDRMPGRLQDHCGRQDGLNTADKMTSSTWYIRWLPFSMTQGWGLNTSSWSRTVLCSAIGSSGEGNSDK